MKLHCITLIVFVFFLGAYYEQEREKSQEPTPATTQAEIFKVVDA